MDRRRMGDLPAVEPEPAPGAAPAPDPAAEPGAGSTSPALAVLDEGDAEVYAELRARRAERRRRLIRRRAIAGGAVAAVLVAAAGLAWALGRPAGEDAAPAVTDVATRGAYETLVEAKGSLEPLSSAVVTPEASGTIAELRVAAGQRVEKGDVVMVLKNDELDRAVADAERGLRSARADRKAAYDSYNRAVDAYNRALAAPAVDGDDLGAASAAAEAPDDSSLGTADRAVETAQAALDQARQAAGKRTVTAPASGSVVALNAQTGAGVGEAATGSDAGRPLLQIADLSQMKVTVQVGEEEIAKVKEGQAAKVTFPAYPDLTLDGSVAGIASAATSASDASSYASDGASQVTFAVDVLIPHPDDRLKPGMTAKVSLATERLDDVVTVPVEALQTDDDGSSYYVNVETDAETGATERRDVEVVTRNDERAVVGKPKGSAADLPEAPVADGDVLVISGGGAVGQDPDGASGTAASGEAGAGADPVS